MQAVLTNGALSYAERPVFDDSEQTLLNEALCAQPFSVPGQWLEWRLIDGPSALPPASLLERARIAYEVETAQEEYLAVQRQAEEVERRVGPLNRRSIAIPTTAPARKTAGRTRLR